MPYFAGFDFEQLMYSSWNVFVDEESIARLIDVFVNERPNPLSMLGRME